MWRYALGRLPSCSNPQRVGGNAPAAGCSRRGRSRGGSQQSPPPERRAPPSAPCCSKRGPTPGCWMSCPPSFLSSGRCEPAPCALPSALMLARTAAGGPGGGGRCRGRGWVDRERGRLSAVELPEVAAGLACAGARCCCFLSGVGGGAGRGLSGRFRPQPTGAGDAAHSQPPHRPSAMCARVRLPTLLWPGACLPLAETPSSSRQARRAQRAVRGAPRVARRPRRARRSPPAAAHTAPPIMAP